MNKPILYFFFFLMIVLAGCRNISDHFAKTGQGMITYKVSYPDSMNFGVRYIMFPRTIVLVFKDDKAAFIATGAMGMVQLVNLLDYKNKKYTSLLIDNLR